MHAAAYVLVKLFRTALIGLALKQRLPALTGINIAVTKKVTLGKVLRQTQLKVGEYGNYSFSQHEKMGLPSMEKSELLWDTSIEPRRVSAAEEIYRQTQ
jgi:hypothetical protein